MKRFLVLSGVKDQSSFSLAPGTADQQLIPHNWRVSPRPIWRSIWKHVHGRPARLIRWL